MQTSIYSTITTLARHKQKQLAVLIDPDRTNPSQLETLITLINLNRVDFVLVGGSLITGTYLDECICTLKKNTIVPVILFPGSAMQLSGDADGVLFLSLISGRNPEFLIGNHVLAAPAIKNLGIEVIPTGYLLIESGKLTSVVYMSNTTPIPSDKADIAVCTAMAGEMLGLKLIYMEAGSGAARPISEEMIMLVKRHISVPLMVGGGIRCAQTARKAWQAGADVVVVGNALEDNPEFLDILCAERDLNNSVNAG